MNVLVNKIDMAKLRKTYMLSEAVVQRLDHVVPDGERSKFVQAAIVEAVDRRIREQACQGLEAIPRVVSDMPSSEELVREHRDISANRSL